MFRLGVEEPRQNAGTGGFLGASECQLKEVEIAAEFAPAFKHRRKRAEIVFQLLAQIFGTFSFCLSAVVREQDKVSKILLIFIEHH